MSSQPLHSPKPLARLKLAAGYVRCSTEMQEDSPEQQKREILAFIQKSGRGGISAAQQKYGVSYIAIRSWKDKGLDKDLKPMKAVLNQIPAKRGRPFGSGNKTQPKVLSNRPGRPSNNTALIKTLASIRSTLNKAESKFGVLETMLA